QSRLLRVSAHLQRLLYPGLHELLLGLLTELWSDRSSTGYGKGARARALPDTPPQFWPTASPLCRPAITSPSPAKNQSSPELPINLSGARSSSLVAALSKYGPL